MIDDTDIARLRAENAALRAQLARHEQAAQHAVPLADQGALFAAFIEHLPIGVCLVGKDGRTLVSNPAYREFLPDERIPSNLTPDEDRGRWRGWDSEGVPIPRAHFPGARALRGELVVPGVDFLYHTRDGRDIWTRVSGVPLRNAQGDITATALVILDIDAEIRAQEKLEHLNATLEKQVADRTADRNALWQLSSDIMIRCTVDGIITAVNPAWTVLLGWREDDLLGATVTDFIHPDDLEETSRAAQELRGGIGHTRFDNRYRHRDGTYRWISWSTRPAEGVVNGVGRDITADKAKADTLARMEEQLRQSQKMEAVGQLTGGLAHDFNNLLAAVMGNLELLQRKVARGRLDDLDRYINIAQGAGRRAASLTQRLLAFSRRQILSPVPTDVNRLIAELEDMLRRTVGSCVDIDVAPSADLWNAKIDGTQLENAILNLCLNARDAMPEGGRLTITTSNVDVEADHGDERGMAPGQYVSISVSDTGTGMSPETIAHAFEPFFTTKPVGQGTGLGLSMIYGFARQSGGSVHIDSAIGHGTTVSMFLPRCDDAVAQEQSEGTAATATAAAGQTVLVVDDEATVRHLIDEVLDELGYTVLSVPDATAALKMLESGVSIDLLVTDVGLPGGMNGQQLADAARAARPGLAVLFVTGFAEDAAVGTGRALPELELLIKPFTLEALTLKVAAALQHTGTPPAG
jgi:PAS domain S-box-containing protein